MESALTVIQQVSGVYDYRSALDRHSNVRGPDQEPAEFLHVRHSKRPRVSSFEELVEYAGEVMARSELPSPGTRLVIDATDCGTVVGSMFDKLNPILITRTSTHMAKPVGLFRNGWPWQYEIGQVILASTLAAAIHKGQLRVAGAVKDSDALRTALTGFTISDLANSDPLAKAAAAALWWVKRPASGAVRVMSYSGEPIDE